MVPRAWRQSKGDTMLDHKTWLRSYLEQLIHRYQNVRSLHEQLQTLELWRAKPNTQAIELGNYFFALVSYSFTRTIIVELCSLLSNKEQRSLVDWLKEARIQASPLAPERYIVEEDKYDPISPKEYSEIVDAHLTAISLQQSVIDRLKAHRDKAIAHLDKVYFNNPDKLYLDYPVHDKDISDLLRLMRDILRDHCFYLFKADVDPDVQSCTGLQTILEYVEAFARARADSSLLERGFCPANYLKP